LILLLISFVSVSFAENFVPFQLSYELISDTYDSKIPKGKYLVEGTIYNTTVNGKKMDNRLPDVRVICGKKMILSDSKGYFRITSKIQDSLLSFVKAGFNDSFFEDFSFRERHHIVVRIFMKLATDENQYIVKKPVIYCYSEKPTQFDFKLIPTGTLTFVYPSLDSNVSWKMKLENNQLTQIHSNQHFPYLFWESNQLNVHFKSAEHNESPREINGFKVSKSNIVSFLDSALTVLGFNYIEKTDFITFWAPQMQKENFYLIQFIQDQLCEQFATYEINPAPDHLNRVYMLFSGNTDAHFPVNIIPQQLKPMERNGFYMVDWGGIAIDLMKNIIAEKNQ
jgi:hypothetical protein